MGGACSGAIVPLMTLTQKRPENYQIQSIIGKGGYAVVYRGKTQKKEIAIKRTIFENPATKEREIDMALAELYALQRVGDHPFIPKIHAAFNEKNSCFLILDYQSGGDLRYHLKSYLLFTECQVAYFISCIGSALNHLHQRGIIHRDIKPENILLSANGVPMLTDFGTAYVEETSCVPICTLSSGTVPYMAPEMLARSKLHSYQVDFWSLGITAFGLLFNCRPSLRNCPKRFIVFGANQYHSLWTKLKSLTEDNEADFEAIDQTISNEDRQIALPFPDSSTSLLLDGEKELPFELTTPIPLQSYAGQRVSTECIELIQSLLDVRIPQRLGQLSKFHLFSEHKWFQRNNCVISLAQSIPPSPYQPNIILLENHLNTKYKNDRLLQPPCSCSCNVTLPEHIEKKLQSYFYVPSSASSSTPSCPSSSSPASASDPSHHVNRLTKPFKQSISTITNSSFDSSEEHAPRRSRSRS
jgi:serine/threonine protein kinase